MWKCACLLVFAVASSLPGQHTCVSCEDKGAVPCKRCPLVFERETEACSEAVACAQCRGAPSTSCPKCEHAAVDKAIQARRASVRRWLNSRRADLLKAAGDRPGKLRSAMYCRTAHVDLVFAPAKITSGPSSNPHILMHVYAQRIAKTRQMFVKTLGLNDSDFSAPPAKTTTVATPGTGGVWTRSPRMRIFVQQHEADYRRVCPNVTGLVHQDVGVERLGGKMFYTLHHDVSDLRDDAALHRNIVHNVTHLLLSNVLPVGWIGERGIGRLDGGLAHYFEARAGGGICSN